MPYIPPPLIPEGRAVISGGATQFSLPGVSLVSYGTAAIAANLVRYLPIRVITPIVIDQLTVEVTSAGAGGTTARLGIYNADLSWQPTTLVVDAGTIAVDANAVVNKAVTQALPAGRYLLAINTDGAPTLRSARGYPPGSIIANALGVNGIVNFLRGAQAYAAFPATGTAWTTAGGGTTPFEYFVFPRVLTP